MKARILFTLIAVIGALAMIFASCVPRAPVAPEEAAHPIAGYPEEVYFGCLYPLSGPCASNGAQLKAGVEIACDEINKAGGIKNLQGAKMVPIFADHQLSGDVGASEAERLITEEDVVCLFSSYACGFPIANKATYYGCPHLVSVDITKEITEPGCDWTFRDFGRADNDSGEMVQGLLEACEEFGMERPKTAAILYDSMQDPLAAGGEAQKAMLDAEGIEVVLYESCTTGTSTFMPTINKLESLAPEAMFVDLSTADHIVFNTEMMERQLNFPYGLWTIGSGMEDPAFYDNVAPEAAELCFVQEDYDCWLGYKPYFDEVNEQCKAKLGYELTSCVACTYSATYVLHDVLERARYHSALDVYRSNILTAMQATDITLDKCVDKRTAPDGTEWCPALFKGIERVQFGEYGQNKYAHGMMSQILSGIHWPTYPTAVRPTDHPGVIFPIPAWSER